MKSGDVRRKRAHGPSHVCMWILYISILLITQKHSETSLRVDMLD